MTNLEKARKDLADARAALRTFGDVYDIAKHHDLTFEEHEEKVIDLTLRVSECIADVERAFWGQL
jgi:hypothetical protein